MRLPFSKYVCTQSIRYVFSTSCLEGISLTSFTGEDALANLSVERSEAGSITGHVRIRSKTQGIALSLGDRITMGKLVFITRLLPNFTPLIQHKKIANHYPFEISAFFCLVHTP